MSFLTKAIIFIVTIILVMFLNLKFLTRKRWEIIMSVILMLILLVYNIPISLEYKRFIASLCYLSIFLICLPTSKIINFFKK